jgi:hypothetical protein
MSLLPTIGSLFNTVFTTPEDRRLQLRNEVRAFLAQGRAGTEDGGHFVAFDPIRPTPACFQYPWTLGVSLKFSLRNIWLAGQDGKAYDESRVSATVKDVRRGYRTRRVPMHMSLSKFQYNDQSSPPAPMLAATCDQDIAGLTGRISLLQFGSSSGGPQLPKPSGESDAIVGVHSPASVWCSESCLIPPARPPGGLCAPWSGRSSCRPQVRDSKMPPRRSGSLAWYQPRRCPRGLWNRARRSHLWRTFHKNGSRSCTWSYTDFDRRRSGQHILLRH